MAMRIRKRNDISYTWSMQKTTLLILILSSLLLGQSAKGISGSGGGMKWVAPARWSAENERPMRLATYKVPAAAGDKEAGECGIFYFGPGQGGDVQANIDRWTGQFQTPGGQPVG